MFAEVNDNVVVDYYAFGGALPGRTASSNSYRYGFNGKEMENELHGNAGDAYDFGARVYDARLGRWMSCDPLEKKYPSFTPYNFAINCPLLFIDPNGKEFTYADDMSEEDRVNFNKAVLELKNSSGILKEYIEAVETSHHQVKVSLEIYMPGGAFAPRSRTGAATEGIGSGGTLLWNPTDADIAPDVFVNGSSIATKERVLMEELIHASRAVQGKAEYSDSEAGMDPEWSSQWGNANEEISTNNIINTIMVGMGKLQLQRRNYHMSFTLHNEEGSIIDNINYELILHVDEPDFPAYNGTQEIDNRTDEERAGN